jgi:hypothetical protein
MELHDSTQTGARDALQKLIRALQKHHVNDAIF